MDENSAKDTNSELIVPAKLRGPVLWLLQYGLSDLDWALQPSFKDEPTEEELNAAKEFLDAHKA